MQLSEQLAGVAVVFLLLGITLWFIGRKHGQLPFLRSKGRGTGALAIIERQCLTTHHMLFLVRVGDRSILIATHPGGVTFEQPGGSFASTLKGCMQPDNEARP